MPGQIAAALAAHGIPQPIINDELERMREHRATGTANSPLPCAPSPPDHSGSHRSTPVARADCSASYAGSPDLSTHPPHGSRHEAITLCHVCR
jgi:hypothetical protein